MNKEKHDMANLLTHEMMEAKKRVSTFEMIRSHVNGYPSSRTFHVRGLGFEIDLPGKCLSQFEDKITKFLQDELSELEKQYKEL